MHLIVCLRGGAVFLSPAVQRLIREQMNNVEEEERVSSDVEQLNFLCTS